MGFWDDVGEVFEAVGGATWEVTKFTGKVVATGAAATAIISTGGLAAPVIGAGVWLGGKAVEEIGRDCDCEFVEGLGDFIGDVGFDGLTGGLIGAGTKAAGHLAAREIARNGRKMTNGAKVLINTGRAIKIGGDIYNTYGNTKEEIEYHARVYHGAHKGTGRSYDGDCPICRGDL
nr:2746_t:CDS:1 [Entrophospora candida]